jgi:hypothetical protein
MASKIRTSFVFFLFIINVIGVTIIYLFLYYYTYDTKKRSLKEIEKIKHKNNNLKISNEILLNNEKINNIENLNNNTHSYFNKEKFNTNYKVKMKKRRLSYGFFDFYFVILALNSLSAFFCLIVLFSFFVKNEERISCCYRSTSGFHFLCFGYYRCDHDLICFENNRGQGFFLLMIALMIIFFFFISIFFIAKFLGKNLSRYISLVSFIFFNFIKILECASYIKDNGENNIYSKNILIISVVLLIFNLSGALLPNLKCFTILRNEPNIKVIISLKGSSNSSKSSVNNLVKRISNDIVNIENNNNYNNNNTFPMAQEQSSEKNENINNSFSTHNKSKINEKTTNIEDISLSITRRDFTSDRKSIGNLEVSTKI